MHWAQSKADMLAGLMAVVLVDLMAAQLEQQRVVMTVVRLADELVALKAVRKAVKTEHHSVAP